jgi:plasmid stability protein
MLNNGRYLNNGKDSSMMLKHGLSVEAEHRQILHDALLKPKKKSFSQPLAEMPNVGCDDDFARGGLCGAN